MTDEIEPSPPPDFYQLIAEQRGVPAGWHWYSLEVAGDPTDRDHGAVVVKGAVCTTEYARGARKGERNWSKRDRSTDSTIVITTRDYDAFKEQWERDSGKCHHCGGCGQEIASVGVKGTTYRPCRRCTKAA